MKISNIFFFFFLFFLSLIIVSCDQDEFSKDQESTDVLNFNNKQVLDYIVSLGFDIGEVNIKGDQVIFDDHITWSKSQILSFLTGEFILDNSVECFDENGCDDGENLAIEDEVEDRQRSYYNEKKRGNIISKTNVKKVKYFIESSVLQDCGYDWIVATKDAATAWTNVSYSRVKITRTYDRSNANIIIQSDRNNPVDENSIIAVANLSVGGRAGRNIWINKNYDNYSKKKQTMMHEFGHTLGIGHTNEYDKGFHLHGTSGSDNNSIFNSHIGSNSYFTTNDKRAIRLLFPSNLDTPINFVTTKTAAGNVRVQYNNQNKTAKPYYWIRVMKYNSYGILVGYKDYRSTSSSTGFDRINWKGHSPGQKYYFSIRGMNFRKDIKSNATAKRSVWL